MHGLKVNEKKVAAAVADPFLLATDVADYLVLRGLPFRDAHEVVGELTAHSLSTGVAFPDIRWRPIRRCARCLRKKCIKCSRWITPWPTGKPPEPRRQRRRTELAGWQARLSPKRPAAKRPKAAAR